MADTFNGDRISKFPSSPASCPASTCIDVYVAADAPSPTISAELEYTWGCPAGAGRYEINGPEALRPNVSVNNVKVLYYQNITSGVDSMADRYCAQYATGDIDTILVVEDGPIENNCTETFQRGFYRQITCPDKVYYYQPGTCSEVVNYRQVECCS